MHLRRRRGAVLICVLVVLLLVALLISQTMQTLLLVRRGADQRQQLRQARELLELGELALRQNNFQPPVNELLIERLGRISFERIPNSDATRTDIRITVHYQISENTELTATQLVFDQEPRS